LYSSRSNRLRSLPVPSANLHETCFHPSNIFNLLFRIAFMQVNRTTNRPFLDFACRLCVFREKFSTLTNSFFSPATPKMIPFPSPAELALFSHSVAFLHSSSLPRYTWEVTFQGSSSSSLICSTPLVLLPFSYRFVQGIRNSPFVLGVPYSIPKGIES